MIRLLPPQVAAEEPFAVVVSPLRVDVGGGFDDRAFLAEGEPGIDNKAGWSAELVDGGNDDGVGVEGVFLALHLLDGNEFSGDFDFKAAGRDFFGGCRHGGFLFVDG